MKKLKEKLRSQSGASILLALLFLLVCMMVAASVLMAAVSNAGKIQSNYEEQQRYLALSSALRLVSDQIEQAKYRGRYTLSTWTETETAEDGSETSADYYSISQAPGAFSCGKLAVLEKNEKDEDGKTAEGALLSFQKELDGLFAGEFTGDGYRPLTGPSVAALPTAAPQVLTVTVQDGDDIGKTFEPVEVEIGMDPNRRIHLKATMSTGTDDTSRNYIMEAELAPSADMPTIRYPVDRMPKSAPDTALLNGTEVVSESQMTDADAAVGWKLDWITGEVKEAGG